MEYRNSVYTVGDELEGWLWAGGRGADWAWASSAASTRRMASLEPGVVINGRCDGIISKWNGEIVVRSHTRTHLELWA